MTKEIEIHYFGNLEVSQDELVGAFNKALPSDKQIARIETIEIMGYGSRFGHLLPERGGDSDFGFRETIELILAFGTVQAFLVFAKAFLSKSGEMLAEKLFKPLSKPERKAALAEEKAKRKNWRSVADETIKTSREYGEWSEDRKKEEYEYWRSWGEAAEAISYNARYSLDIYVEEKDATQHVSFELNNEDLQASKAHLFVQAPEDRFRETVALGLIRFIRELEEKEERSYEGDIEQRKRTMIEIRRVLREARNRNLI